MASECMKTLQQFSTTSVWKPFSMQWPFWIQPSELLYWWRRRISLSFPIPVQPNVVTCHGHFMTRWKKRALISNWQRLVGFSFTWKWKKATSTNTCFLLMTASSLVQVKDFFWDQHGTFYRKNTVMCFYSMVALSSEHVLELPSRNYLMKVCNGYIDARKFESFNLARFANQGPTPGKRKKDWGQKQRKLLCKKWGW